MDKTKDQVIRTGNSLSWEEWEAMIREFLSGHYTKVELWKKYTGQDKEHGQLLRRIWALGYVSDENSIERKKKFLHSRIRPLETLDTGNSDKDPVEPQKRIKELEKQLEAAQWKTEGYELMIEIAGKELKIPIRKKSGVK